MKSSVRVVAAAAILAVSVPVGAAPRVPTEPPLVVLIVIDGLRAGELERWAPHLGNGGLRRLVDGGTLFERAEYPYATTKTCPGHATISTGTLPARHGIVGNDWFDREAGAVVSCVADAASPTLGADADAGVSGRRLRAPALADQVVAGGRRAIAVSLKDRAAAMLAGRRGVAFWWGTDGFITSRGYAGALPAWVAAWNQARPRQDGTRWERLADRRLYDAVGADDAPLERPPEGLGRTFPHPVRDDSAVYTPAGADWVLELALAAVRAGAVGSGDLLAISVSTVDVVGHTFGPDSHEAIDTLLRLDRAVEVLLTGLDRELGAGRYVVALTADHGMGSPPPAERRVPGTAIVAAAEGALDAALGAGDWVASFREPHVYLRLGAAGRAAVAARAIARVPGVAAAFTAREVATARSGLALRVRRSAAPPRSGDVIVVAEPGYLIGPDDDIAASHGTPHAHDRHVPLIVLAPGLPARRIGRAVSPVDLAPTLARWLGVRLPDADGTALVEALPTARR
jgi:hypothetical protein